MELLSPAGNMEALVAAVQNGANAVYLGFGDYNARRSAGNFTEPEFIRAVEYCHERSVKVHVTLNTLVKQAELPGVINAVEVCARTGADALIVQDIGLAGLVKRICPTLAVHASTQLAITNAFGAEFARDHGFARAVLARECSLAELRRCRDTGIEIETFVHGALCVCLSGQCLMSSMIGGRSGNRGLCAQPCRLPYTMECGDASGYLLSPRDIMRIDELAELRNAGVCSLKIEGRLKRPEYVAIVTRAYRTALDALESGGARTEADMTALQRELAQIFNRGGFTDAYLDEGFRDNEIMYPERPNNLGVHVGEILSSKGNRARVQAFTALHAGDQIALRTGADELGFELDSDIAPGESNAILPKPATTGMHIYRAGDAWQLARAKESWQRETRLADIKINARLTTGMPAELTITGDMGEVCATGETVQAARNQPLTREKAAAALAKLGDSPYRLAQLDMELSENAFMAVSALNGLRRDALSAYRARVIDSRRGCELPEQVDSSALAFTAAELAGAAQSERTAPLICVQSADVADALLGDCFYWQPEHIDFESLTAGLARIPETVRVYLRLPQMTNTPELAELERFMHSNSARLSGAVLTNVSQLALAIPGERIAGPELYAWNTAALARLHDMGISRIGAPLELTAAELSELARYATWELLIYGRATLMTLRHCPVSARYGTRHIDCRRCESGCGAQSAHIVDRKNFEFPFSRYRGASGCYVQLLNSAPHQLLTHLRKLPRAAYWRAVFTDEPRARRESILAAMKAAAQGIDMRAAEFHGTTTTGHNFRGVD